MPALNSESSITVIGAGVVGLSCALWLQHKGFQVTVIDPEPPGSGTSSGNACTIAEYGCIPVNSPALFRQLPALMLSKESPLTVNPLYAMRRLGWMFEFLTHCRKEQVAHIIRSIGGLLSHTWAGLDPLLELSASRNLVAERGFMQVYRDQREFDMAWPGNQKRREQGIDLTPLDAAEIRELEPALKIPFQRGVLYSGITQVLDPQALCARYADCLQKNGGQLVRKRVASLAENSTAVTLMLQSGDRVNADRVVIAAGAFSRFIGGMDTVLRKLDTERGYHVLYRDRQNLLSRPVSWHAAGFYATPMNLGMRVAGMVEIAGYRPEKNPRIIAYLGRKAAEMLELPSAPDTSWLGYRPTFSDSLPAIGYARGSNRIILAVGHQHLGLTLSGITGRLVSELAAGEPLHCDIAPFSPARFG